MGKTTALNLLKTKMKREKGYVKRIQESLGNTVRVLISCSFWELCFKPIEDTDSLPDTPVFRKKFGAQIGVRQTEQSKAADDTTNSNDEEDDWDKSYTINEVLARESVDHFEYDGGAISNEKEFSQNHDEHIETYREPVKRSSLSNEEKRQKPKKNSKIPRKRVSFGRSIA